MAALDPNPDSTDRARQRMHDEPVAPMPRWVKAFAAVLVGLLVVLVAMHLAGGGFRGHGS